MSSSNDTPESPLLATHTYIDPKTLIDKKSLKILGDLSKKAESRDPDAHDLYIYNDFYGYAILDLVDKELTTLHTKIVKKEWDEAYHHLEALTHFLDREDAWLNVDDGERAELTNKVFGACVISVLRALRTSSPDKLNPTNYPSLESLLRAISSFGKAVQGLFSDSTYHLTTKAIGLRLFAKKSDALVELEKQRAEAWVQGLDTPKQRRLARKMMGLPQPEGEVVAEADDEDEDEDEDEEDDDDDGKPWWHGAKPSHEDYDDKDYKLTRAWKEYKEYLQGVPTKPMKGPPQWDLTKWSAAQKAQFSLSRGMDSDDDDDMFF